jgi:indole-3-glycerol phosphate synthase/phosphoribosylanthranilate isomerase/anthranilate synthase/indole-3-glycerol phosphate synthase/phosphoribosylanthranilate isomerase
MDVLSEIIAVKRQRLAAAKARAPLDEMRALALQSRSSSRSHRFARALRNENRVNIIAEFKRRSPSKGKINERAQPAAMAAIYESAGAAAISVLTEEDYFEGSLADLRSVRDATQLPVLRKDFIVDEYQVYESAVARADALLLIVAALDDETLTRLRLIAEDELGMDALVEVHTKAELDRALQCGARVIGVNNRDLRTFTVSTTTSAALARLAPRDAILISESGLNPEEVRKLRAFGYNAFLVGETLMRSNDPANSLRELIEQPKQSSNKVWVKICGITNVEDARAAIEAGADMLGFNFYKDSPRFITPEAAREIIRALRVDSRVLVSMIGVFVNESSDKVVRLAEEADLDGLQLHGDETIEYCRRLKQEAPRQFLVKVLSAASPREPEALKEFAADAVMIDAHDPKLRGGTGKLADWTWAKEMVAQLPRVFLAGGLSPENVAEAIVNVHPYAVDACSSLESSPGKKSAKRMREFVEIVRTSTLQSEVSTAGEGN